MRRDERLDEAQPVEPRRELVVPAAAPPARRRGFPLAEEELVASADGDGDGGGGLRGGAVAGEELGDGGHGDGGRGGDGGGDAPHHRRSSSRFPLLLAGGDGILCLGRADRKSVV